MHKYGPTPISKKKDFCGGRNETLKKRFALSRQEAAISRILNPRIEQLLIPTIALLIDISLLLLLFRTTIMCRVYALAACIATSIYVRSRELKIS